MIKKIYIYLYVCLIIFIFLIIIHYFHIKFFNTIENFKYGYNCLTCASCNTGGYLADTDISSQNNGEFNYFEFVNHDNSDSDHKIYIFNVYTDLICDILIVGGGGPGGTYRDETTYQAGGGAGGVVYIVNQVLPPNIYKIKVGRGGKRFWNGSEQLSENGKDSMITDSSDNIINLTVDNNGSNQIIELIGYGGGPGAFTDYDTPYSTAPKTFNSGGNGGSGGGGTWTSTNFSGWGGYSIQGNTFWNGEEFVQGGNDGHNAISRRAGAGGGAGGTADRYRGGHGVQIDITGERKNGEILYYGGGGGSSEKNQYSTQGFGGNGGGGTVGGQYWGGGPGLRDSGGGGGGAGHSSYGYGGEGGSGVVIIRYL
jgi:hypothetical protein